ncbi:DNA-3-methyladenine glycosylase 2, partial [Enterobacter sp. BT223]|uniref:AlkA N-terminal domain-containing protein n=1 Tax=Enterobacter sp. BT223 TaxID=2969206 RepID=UPI0027D20A44
MYTLTWQPPYDWQWMFGFLGARAVEGVETVTEHYYERSFACEGHQGIFRVTPDNLAHTLQVTLSPGLIPVAQTCLERIGRLFDLACDPHEIHKTLGDLGVARPGLRFPCAMDAYAQGVRAILVPLLAVAFAAKLMSPVVALFTCPVYTSPGSVCFPTQQALA